MSRASHAAAFLAGAVVASAVVARAVPRADVARFKSIDAFAQALATVEANYVDATDERKLLYDAARGMLHNLDPHSTFLAPSRYQHVRQDTEGEFGGLGVTLAPGEVDDARPSVPPYPTIDAIVRGSPADLAGLQLDDSVVTVSVTCACDVDGVRSLKRPMSPNNRRPGAIRAPASRAMSPEVTRDEVGAVLTANPPMPPM